MPMTDRKPDALTPSSRPGALRKAPTGDLVARGLEDRKALEQIVVFPDKNLETAVREALGKSEWPLTSGDLESLEELSHEDGGIKDLTGLEHCVNLTKLNLFSNLVGDLTPLASLTNLTRLNLKGCPISDITPLASLTNLTHFYLGGNQISDLTPLAALTNLTALGLEDNQVSDLTPLAALTNLTVLSCGENQISDITPLLSLSNLELLWLEYNPLSQESLDVHVATLESREVGVVLEDEDD